MPTPSPPPSRNNHDYRGSEPKERREGHRGSKSGAHNASHHRGPVDGTHSRRADCGTIGQTEGQDNNVVKEAHVRFMSEYCLSFARFDSVREFFAKPDRLSELETILRQAVSISPASEGFSIKLRERESKFLQVFIEGLELTRKCVKIREAYTNSEEGRLLDEIAKRTSVAKTVRDYLIRGKLVFELSW